MTNTEKRFFDPTKAKHGWGPVILPFALSATLFYIYPQTREALLYVGPPILVLIFYASWALFKTYREFKSDAK